jgi:protoporphyrinogen/coproporphyrinogen III oxidase
MSESRVIVVGAGIAGLTAAYHLSRAGINVRVLESSDRVGGRMSTERLDGFIVDRGAQFLSSQYGLILSLARDLGLAPSIQRTSPWSAVVRNKKIHRIKADRPLDLLTSELFTFSECLKFGLGILPHLNSLRSLPMDNYSLWSRFDTETAAAGISRMAAQQIMQKVSG